MIETLNNDESVQIGIDYDSRVKKIPNIDQNTKDILAAAAIGSQNFDSVRTAFENIAKPHSSVIVEKIKTFFRTYEPSAVMAYPSVLFKVSPENVFKIVNEVPTTIESPMIRADLAAIAAAHDGNIKQTVEIYNQLGADPFFANKVSSQEGFLTLTSAAFMLGNERVKQSFAYIYSELNLQGNGEAEAILTLLALNKDYSAKSALDNFKKLREGRNQKDSILKNYSDAGLAVLAVACDLGEELSVDTIVNMVSSFFKQKGINSLTALRLTLATIGQQNQKALLSQENAYTTYKYNIATKQTQSTTTRNLAIMYLGEYN